MALYVNGALVTSATTTRSIVYDTHVVQIGADTTSGALSYPFNGKIDEVRLYNRALTASEVQNTYAFENPHAFAHTGGTTTVAGTMNVTAITQSGGTFTDSGSVSANGATSFAGTATTISGTLNTSGAASFGATTTAVNGTVTASGGISIAAAKTLLGTGTLVGNVSNDGTINPAGAGVVGTLTITGNYTQSASGSLGSDIAGSNSGQYDVLAVSGSTTLAGSVTTSMQSGFVPNLANADTFHVLTYASRTGSFGSYSLSDNGTAALGPYYRSTVRSERGRQRHSIFWVNASGGDWDTASNWSTGVVPVITDNAYQH